MRRRTSEVHPDFLCSFSAEERERQIKMGSLANNPESKGRGGTSRRVPDIYWKSFGPKLMIVKSVGLIVKSVVDGQCIKDAIL